MSFKSILKPDASVAAGAATIGAVVGIYQLNIGTVATAHLSDANMPAAETSRKKAGYTALVLVSGLTLITKDANVAILGGATIIAMELSYRHAIMAHPLTGKLTPPDSSSYQPVDASMVPDYPPIEDTDYSTEGAYR